MSPGSFWDSLFAGCGWYRRLRGGHWERWNCNVVHCMVWMQMEQCSGLTGCRPCGCFGRPTCEDPVGFGWKMHAKWEMQERQQLREEWRAFVMARLGVAQRFDRLAFYRAAGGEFGFDLGAYTPGDELGGARVETIHGLRRRMLVVHFETAARGRGILALADKSLL